MGHTPEEAIAIDHQVARDYASKYVVRLQNQVATRGLILTGAIQEFNKFLTLEPSSNMAAAVWDFAFELLSKAVPALKLGEFIKKQHEMATIALKAAEAFGRNARRADKVVKGVTGAAQVLGKVAEMVNDGKGIKEKADKVFETPKTLSEHASRKPIKELIAELDGAEALWSTAIDAERAEWANRLADNPSQWGSLEMLVKAVLPDPPAFTAAELDEIWTLYLYKMVGQWVGPHREVTIIKTVTDWGYGQKTTELSIDGLNDTQKSQILQWFGPSIRRGRIFTEKPVTDMYEFLQRFPAQTEIRRRNNAPPMGAKYM